jgi:hypothetical protein
MSKKLCSWSEKRIKKKRDQLVSLVARPTHFCKKCGRAANEKSALCRPEALES